MHLPLTVVYGLSSILLHCKGIGEEEARQWLRGQWLAWNHSTSEATTVSNQKHSCSDTEITIRKCPGKRRTVIVSGITEKENKKMTFLENAQNSLTLREFWIYLSVLNFIDVQYSLHLIYTEPAIVPPYTFMEKVKWDNVHPRCLFPSLAYDECWGMDNILHCDNSGQSKASWGSQKNTRLSKRNLNSTYKQRQVHVCHRALWDTM